MFLLQIQRQNVAVGGRRCHIRYTMSVLIFKFHAETAECSLLWTVKQESPTNSCYLPNLIAFYEYHMLLPVDINATCSRLARGC